METHDKKIKIAAISDIHIKPDSQGAFTNLFAELSEKADVVVLGGDLCDHGEPHEAEILVNELKALRIPAVAIMGNHDYTSGHQDQIKHILSDANVHMLENGPVEIKGIGFAGVKGFGGGFGTHMLASFGEEGMKNFVKEVMKDVLQLENSLLELKTEKKVVIMHYSPIQETVEGEPPAIFPFLGCSRLEEPINNYGASIVFHGHAHWGSDEGKTTKGIPVFNVAYPRLKQTNPDQPYKLVEV